MIEDEDDLIYGFFEDLIYADYDRILHLREDFNESPFAALIRTILGAKELKTETEIDVSGMMSTDWERVEFWIKR